MSVKRAVELANLSEHMVMSATIICSSCKEELSYEMDEQDAMEEFYKMGWRVVNGKCLCPECIKTIK